MSLVFDEPALAIKLNPIKLTAQYRRTTLLDSHTCVDTKDWDESVEYGDYLNQCIAFDVHRYDAVIALLTNQLVRAMSPNDMAVVFRLLRATAHTSFEVQFARELEFHALRILDLPKEQRVKQLEMEIAFWTMPTGKALLHLLAAYQLAPFAEVTTTEKEAALGQLHERGFMPPVIAADTHEIIVLQTGPLDRTINTFIWHMRTNQLYLHQCSVCGRWFVCTHKHKSAFCGGGFCLTAPQDDAKKRYLEKVERSPHWLAYHKAYNMWAQRKNKGKISAEQCAAWRQEAARQRNQVDKGLLSLADYENWLKLCVDTGKKDLTLLPVEFWITGI